MTSAPKGKDEMLWKYWTKIGWLAAAGEQQGWWRLKTAGSSMVEAGVWVESAEMRVGWASWEQLQAGPLCLEVSWKERTSKKQGCGTRGRQPLLGTVDCVPKMNVKSWSRDVEWPSFHAECVSLAALRMRHWKGPMRKPGAVIKRLMV